MDYEIEHSEEDGCVQIRVYKSITADLERSFAKEAIATARQNGVLNYIADVRGAPNVAGILDQYRLAYEDMVRFGLDRSSRIAVLVSKGDHSHDFIDIVFYNAGYRCQLFTDEGEARRWLNE